MRLLALDIDGTLLRSDKTVSPRNRAALDAARARGVELVLVTGRRYPAARRVAEQLGGALDLVLHNGALIVESNPSRPRSAAAAADSAPNVVSCEPLRRDLALRAIRVGRAREADPVVHCGLRAEGRLLVEGVSPSNTLLAYYLDKSHPDVTPVDDLERALAEDPIQVMFGGSITAMDALLPHLRAELAGEVRLERTVYPANGVGLIDVLAPQVSKAAAVAFLQRRWGVSREETLAIGDNWNDQEMLQQAGLGLVMGNAEPGLKALGLPLLPTSDEDGVAVAIEQYVLRP